MKTIEFDDDTIQKLFGHEAAEDEDEDRFREYFLKTKTYKNFNSNMGLRILVGHKGTGKSAIVKYSALEDRDSKKLPIFVQPNDVINITNNSNDFLKIVKEWEDGLLEIISSKVLRSLSIDETSKVGNIKSNSLKFADFLIETVKVASNYVDLNSTRKKLIDNFLETQKIVVYIDDLDRGWKNSVEDRTRISALLNAVRDISNENKNIMFKISLRTDVYYSIRTSDESTDKIENSVVWLAWSNDDIFRLLIKRINTFFNISLSEDDLNSLKQAELAKYLNLVMTDRFKGYGKWSNIPTYRMLMSLIRKRPRDLVKLCTLSAKHAYNSDRHIIETQDFQAIFEEYSQGRIQDTINEYRSELPDIERLIIGMKPNKKEKTTNTGYIYAQDALNIKINNIIERGTFTFTNKKEANTKELIHFLYKINFLTARKKEDASGKIDRKYFDETRYLSGSFEEFGYSWEMHPAYRWALQPDNILSVYELLDTNYYE